MPQTPDDKIKQFKRKAWRNRAAALNYVRAVSTDSLGTEREKRLITSFARGKILDAGAGNGRITSHLVGLGMDVVAFDISMHMLCMQPRSNRRVCGDIENPPFKSHCFDTIIATWVLLHFPHWEKLLDELVRLLKPGGLLVFEMSSLEHLNWVRQVNPGVDQNYQKPKNYESFVDRTTIASVLAGRGISLKQAIPYDHLNANMLFDHAATRITQGKEGIKEYFKSDDVHRFWLWIEAHLLAAFPAGLSHKTFFVAEFDGLAAPDEAVLETWPDRTVIFERVARILSNHGDAFVSHFNDVKEPFMVFNFMMALEELLLSFYDINLMEIACHLDTNAMSPMSLERWRALLQQEITFWHERFTTTWYSAVGGDSPPEVNGIPIGPLMEYDLLPSLNQTMAKEISRI